MGVFNSKKKSTSKPAQPAPQPTLTERLNEGLDDRDAAESALARDVARLEFSSARLVEIYTDAEAEAQALLNIANAASLSADKADARALKVREVLGS